mgnify:CR=1 FL=1
MNRWTTLVSCEELAASLGDPNLVVLDARVVLSDRSAGAAQFLDGHVPGARHADLEHDLSDMAQVGQGRHPWPTQDAFLARARAWGIGPSSQVVAYDAGDGALAAARAWFLLEALGHAAVAVLDGGWRRWTALGLPVERGAAHGVAHGTLDARFDATRLLDAQGVQQHLAAGGMLVDARAAERFRGDVEPLDTRAGHVPGAVNRPYAMNLADDGRFKPAQVLADEFDALRGTHAPADIAVMCGSGVTACHHLLAMEHAGLHGAKLFTGSWSGWIADPGRPIATGDR